MKKLILVTLVIILTVGTVLSACAEPTAAPAPAPAPQPAPAPEPEQPGKYIVIEPAPAPAAPTPKTAQPPETVYKLIFTDWGPPHIDIAMREREWAAAIEERTGGRVHIDWFFAEALLRRADTFRGIEAGLADGALYVSSGMPELPLNQVIILPGIGMPSQVAQHDIYLKLVAKYPELEEEYGNCFPIYMRGMPGEHLHLTDKFHAVRVPEDMAGLKAYCNTLWADQWQTVNAVVVNIPPMEWYTSLERNLIQGFFGHWLAIFSFGLTELMKYHTIIGEGGGGMNQLGYIMNRDSYAELPADIQKIFMDATDEFFGMYKVDDVKTQEAGLAMAAELGNEVIYLTPEEQQQWFDLAKPIREQWLAKREAEGNTRVREIYADMMQMIAEYK